MWSVKLLIFPYSCFVYIFAIQLWLVNLYSKFCVNRRNNYKALFLHESCLKHQWKVHTAVCFVFTWCTARYFQQRKILSNNVLYHFTPQIKDIHRVYFFIKPCSHRCMWPADLISSHKTIAIYRRKNKTINLYNYAVPICKTSQALVK